MCSFFFNPYRTGLFRTAGPHQYSVDTEGRHHRQMNVYHRLGGPDSWLQYHRPPATCLLRPANATVLKTPRCWAKRNANDTYRVGSANFSQRKIGHGHDTSADSEDVAGVSQRSVHSHFIFRFENGPGNQSFFSIHDQNTAETSQPQAQPTDDWRAMDRASPRGLKRPLEKLDSARLSRNKKKNRQTSRIEESFCWKATILKKANTTDLERDLQRTRLRRSTNDRRRRTWAPSEGRSGFFFFCFFFLRSSTSKNFRFAFIALNVSNQSFTWKISICSAKSNHVLRCSLSGELAMGRPRLRTVDRVAASQLQLT